MEKKKPREPDSILGGTVAGLILFTGIGIFDMITKKENAFIAFVLGGLCLIFLIYLLKKTKNNTNERYEDERKKFVRDKSKSMSFDRLFAFMVVFQILIRTGKIKMDSYDVIMVTLGSAIIIRFVSYLTCKSKY